VTQSIHWIDRSCPGSRNQARDKDRNEQQYWDQRKRKQIKDGHIIEKAGQ
jgi:hypothetical protein